MKFLTFALAAAPRYFSTRSSSVTTASASFDKKKRYFLAMKSKKYKSRDKKPKIAWTDEQTQILEAVRCGQSVFITGSAGTGKTFLLEQIIKELKKIRGRSRVYVTASTGVAACALNGQTLHSFAGIGQGSDDDNPKSLFDRVLLDARARNRWRKASVLCIDEISMISAGLFEGLEYVARTLRGEEASKSGQKVWGGLQLIVSGDFFQLPPIISGKRKNRRVYAFESECWNASFDLQIELTKVFRQLDSLLIQLLQGIRKGENDPAELKLLEECCSGCEPDPSAVILFPRTGDVREVNKRKLESLGQKTYVYKAQDSGEEHWIRQFRSGIVPDELELCVGAQVMLIKNLSPWRNLVNGSTGVVIDLCMVSETDYKMHGMCNDCCRLPLVKFDSGCELLVKPETWIVMDGDKVVAIRRQVPLMLSWALSIHKCQGMTLDKLHTDLSRVFGFGMVYVALSRVRSLVGLSLSGLDPSKIKAHPKVLEFYKNFEHGASDC